MPNKKQLKNSSTSNKQNRSYIVEIIVIIFTTAMTSATFWPLAFDLIDYTASILGYPAEYASFNAITPLYYFTMIIIGFAIIYMTRAFFYTLIFELANKAAPNEQKIQIKYLDTKSLPNVIQLTVAAMVVFLVAYYSLLGRLELIKLKNSNENLELRIQYMSDAMACMRNIHKDNPIEAIRTCYQKN